MKFIFTILFFISLNCFSQTHKYYFASNGDDSRNSVQAQNPLTPWASLTKLNQFFTSLVAGDTVFFNKGDTFTGSLTINKSGNSGGSINFSSYGTGANPIISGFTTVSSWTSIGGGLYTATVSGGLSSLNMVTLDGQFQAIGRYPKLSASNSGYLTIDSHSGSTSISSTGLSGIPNFVGGEIVIRKTHWILDRETVLTQNSSTVTFTNHYTVYPIQNNYGFFFQNSPNACTSLGDWSYNGSTHVITMYFGAENPNSHSIKVSTTDNLISASSQSYITFNNISFQGSNSRTFNLSYVNHLQLSSCDLSFAGTNAIYTNGGCTNTSLLNVTANYTNNNFIVANESTGWNIFGSTITNTGMIAGMGVGDDGAYFTMQDIGGNSSITYNNITNSGYLGMDFTGNNITVSNNYFYNFCVVKDDGAAIYTGRQTVFTNRTVSNNVIITGGNNGIVDNGTDGGGSSYGIYVDQGSHNVNIIGNTIAFCYGAGIHLNSANDIQILNNTVYDNIKGFDYTTYSEDTIPIRNLTQKGNIFFAKTASELCAFPQINSPGNAISTWGTFDSNYYCRPILEPNNINQNGSYGVGTTGGTMQIADFVGGTIKDYSLNVWQTITSQDVHSKKTLKTITDTSQLRFYYNETNVAKTFNLDAVYIDVYGTPYLGSVTLQPYTSVILIFSSNNIPNPLSATITQNAPIICNGNTISLTAQGIGGTPPYTYLWTTGATTQTVIGIHSGNYSVQVTDAAGVIANQSIFVSQPSAITASVSFGTAPATVTTTANGGTGTLTYKLDAGSYQSSNIFTAVAAGNHTITVKDANSCTSSPINFTVISAGVPLAITASSSNPDCYGGNGSVTIGASGGTSPYTGTGVFAQAAGTVTYTVTDNVGAKHDTTITITNPPIITIVQITLDSSISVYGGTTKIYIAATGGTGSLQYKLDGGSYQSADSFSTVSAGNHIITVKDDNSCTQAQTFTLTQPSPTPSSYFILRRRKFKNG